MGLQVFFKLVKAQNGYDMCIVRKLQLPLSSNTGMKVDYNPPPPAYQIGKAVLGSVSAKQHMP